VTAGVELGREAFDRRAWRAAYDALSSAPSLGVDDLERLAIAAHLVGRDGASDRAWEEAHLACLAAGDADRSARCAFWLALMLHLRGEHARGNGWIARAERLAEETGPTASARGFLLVATFLQQLEAGEAASAFELADQILGAAARSGDRDLRALGLLARGQASLALGHVAAGLKLLDEVMVSVTTGEVGPIPAGIVYCAVIEACVDVFDLRRAAEWNESLDEWCSTEPDLVPFRGQCLVHRSQLLSAHGDWAEALIEVDRASARLADPPHPALAIARYQQGELHRLRGELVEAAAAYRLAAELGRDPAPGVALLRLAEGDVPAAESAIRRMLAERPGAPTRPPVLAAAVEVHLAAGGVEAARRASDELTALADRIDTPLLHALADGAAGAVLLAEGDADRALVALRRADARWRASDMPYDVARVRVAIARACLALGDRDAAAVELAAARATFERLGAAPDLERIGTVGDRHAPGPGALTAREVAVLRLVATGRTNKQIAAALTISAHTVARHVQNIFVKLDVSSRAAATAAAYQHGLIE
jgi:ATP/maltotriose-dependent transcriptional regulator MalT